MDRCIYVIMAGGKGQRFWPLSTEERPKQFLDLEGSGRTLLQSTFERLLPLAGAVENVFVATARPYVSLVTAQLPGLPAANILIEPAGRDSAPAIALAALEIERRFGECLTAFFPSDHRIGDVPAFHEVVRRAVDYTELTRGLTTLGIRPTEPATGYGYIEAGAPVGPGFPVKRFVEKPDLARARSYLEAGTFSWNAGMFVWHTGTILEELTRHRPDLMEPLRDAFERGRVEQVFPTLPKVSIDYAVMERTDRAYVLPGRFDWDDLGDWVALERLLAGDGANAVVGRHIGLEARGNILYADDEGDTIVTIGIEDLVVVKRGNTVLLARKDRVQDIKQLLQHHALAAAGG